MLIRCSVALDDDESKRNSIFLNLLACTFTEGSYTGKWDIPYTEEPVDPASPMSPSSISLQPLASLPSFFRFRPSDPPFSKELEATTFIFFVSGILNKREERRCSSSQLSCSGCFLLFLFPSFTEDEIFSDGRAGVDTCSSSESVYSPSEVEKSNIFARDDGSQSAKSLCGFKDLGIEDMR